MGSLRTETVSHMASDPSPPPPDFSRTLSRVVLLAEDFSTFPSTRTRVPAASLTTSSSFHPAALGAEVASQGYPATTLAPWLPVKTPTAVLSGLACPFDMADTSGTNSTKAEDSSAN